MVFSSAFTKTLKLSFVLMVAAPLAMATGAAAQEIKRSPLLPKVDRAAPWQKALEKLYRPVNPQKDLDRAKSSIFDDPAKKLGLPSHGIDRPSAPDAPVVAPVTLDPAVSHLDVDGDGLVSRKEYIQGRSRLSKYGVKTNRNSQRRNQRLQSQFRKADSNRDGKVSPLELQSVGQGRF